jgi:hypothetical protein
MREFEAAIGRAGFTNNDQPIEFKLGDDVLTANPPTTGQLALFFQGGRQRGFRTITSLMEFISDILNDRDWAKVQEKLRDGLDVDVLSEIATYLIGEWSGRPTTPSSASSPTRKGTGRRSTVKQPAKASTT